MAPTKGQNSSSIFWNEGKVEFLAVESIITACLIIGCIILFGLLFKLLQKVKPAYQKLPHYVSFFTINQYLKCHLIVVLFNQGS